MPTYYVCDDGVIANAGAGSGWVTGNDANNGTSRSTSFKTIQAAEDTVIAGDVVTVGDGTYDPFEIRAAGSSDNWITFQAENQHGALIDGGVTSVLQDVSGINIYRTKYINIDGFEIIKCSIGVAVRGVHKTDTSTDINLKKLKIHGLGRLYTDIGCNDGSSPPWTGIYTQGAVFRVLVDRCIIYDIGRLENNCCNNNGVPISSEYFYDHNVYLTGHEHTMQNCILYNAYSGWPLKLSGTNHPAIAAFGYKIINNVIAHPANQNHNTSPLCDSRNPVGHIEHVIGDTLTSTIRNNIFYNPPGECVIWQGDGNLNNITFENNITSAQDWIFQYDGTGTLSTSNCVKALALASFHMTDPVNNDFTLLSNASLLIDQGIATDTPSHDYLGNPRPYNSVCDIGAYEYQGFMATPYTRTRGIIRPGTRFRGMGRY